MAPRTDANWFGAALFIAMVSASLLLPGQLVGQIPSDSQVQRFCQENDATACTDLMRRRARLQALAGIGPVQVVFVGDNLPHLTEDAVVTLVRDRLEAAGVELMPDGPGGPLGSVFMETGLQLLRVSMDAFPRGSDAAELLLKLDFSEVADVRRTRQVGRSATWEAAYRLPAPPSGVSASQAALGLVESLVGRFVADFTEANPRGRPR